MLKQKSSTCSIVSMFIVISKRLYGNSYGKDALTLGCTSDMTKDYCGDENLAVIHSFTNLDRNITFCNKTHLLVKAQEKRLSQQAKRGKPSLTPGTKRGKTSSSTPNEKHSRTLSAGRHIVDTQLTAQQIFFRVWKKMGTHRGKPPRKTERGRNMSFTPGVERTQARNVDLPGSPKILKGMA